ncbi:MAG: 50S ribosome-binding GTPase, partial [Actinomycetota bacterium]|nr:50S ribosome-binding GTPase [Actinomycetota bacterium]
PVREHLRDPLRIAIAGRVKAGKSTLVNALVGQRVAPTAVEECTKVVTWFSYGVPERAEVVLRDRSRRVVPLRDGKVPDAFGVPLPEIDYVHVYLSRDSVRHVTYIDTPGLASVNEQYSDRTEELLGDRASRQASRQADALVFLLSSPARQDEAEALEAFSALFKGTHASPATAVAVLSRADQIGGDGNPLETAAKLAERQAEALRSVASTVVPMAGLLAQTTEARELEERDAFALELLARADPLEREQLLFSHEELLRYDTPVPETQRRRLAALLDLFGIGRALELIDAGADGAGALERELRKISGIDRLRTLLDETFAQRADALKANAALEALSRISWQAADAQSAPALLELREAVEDLRLEPDMRVIAEIWAAQAAAAPETLLPESLQADIALLMRTSDPAGKVGLPPGASARQVQSAARERIAQWREYANLNAATEAEARIARIMYRSFEALAAG